MRADAHAVGTESRNKLPREWVSAVVRMLEREAAVVRVVIAEVRGSAPREPGAFMLVGRGGVEGTIGGGRLEWESIAEARLLLDDPAAAAGLNKVVLGADLGQCCGGVVAVWLERFTRDDMGMLRLAGDSGARGPAVLSSTIKRDAVERRLVAGAADATYPCVLRDEAGLVTFLERLDDAFPALWLYGAGHVGQALARILAELPLRLTWVDSRADVFPATVPDGIRVRRDADSLATVADAPAGALFLVMTHSHPLDFGLCQAILARGDFAWLGLIGSASKAARFRSRLARAGVSAGSISRLVCPIGVEGIASKWPTAIAVGVAAQVMQQISAAAREIEDEGRSKVADDASALAAHRLQPGASRSEPTMAADCGGENCATCGSAAHADEARNDEHGAQPDTSVVRSDGRDAEPDSKTAPGDVCGAQNDSATASRNTRGALSDPTTARRDTCDALSDPATAERDTRGTLSDPATAWRDSRDAEPDSATAGRDARGTLSDTVTAGRDARSALSDPAARRRDAPGGMRSGEAGQGGGDGPVVTPL